MIFKESAPDIKFNIYFATPCTCINSVGNSEGQKDATFFHKINQASFLILTRKIMLDVRVYVKTLIPMSSCTSDSNNHLGFCLEFILIIRKRLPKFVSTIILI